MENKTFFPKVSDNIVSTIRNSNTFAILSHMKPDGDAVYSSLAMKNILNILGKKVYLYSEGPFISKEVREKEPLFEKDVTEVAKKEIDAVIVLDCSTKDRPGKSIFQLADKETIVIDHHSSGSPFYKEELSYIVPESPSTTLLVDSVREALSIPLDKETARYLFIGFLTDSGFFHFLSEKQAGPSLEKVTSFVSTGLSPYEIFDYINDGRSLNDIKNISRIISGTESYFDGELLICYEPDDIDFVERPSFMIYPNLLEVDGVKVVSILKKRGNDIEFGFRAKEKAGIDVGKLASSLGGGGHRLAAGATVSNITPEEGKEMLLALFPFLS